MALGNPPALTCGTGVKESMSQSSPAETWDPDRSGANHLGDGGDKELMWTGCSLAVALGMLLVPWQLTVSTRRHPCSQLLPGTGPHVALVPLEGN